jgi:hypothetical protein
MGTAGQLSHFLALTDFSHKGYELIGELGGTIVSAGTIIARYNADR